MAQLVNIVMSSLATLQVQVPISAILNGSPNYNPTADVVKMAFIAPNVKPAASDWQLGSWTTNPGPEYMAQCLVGPGSGGFVVAVGVWAIWVMVIDNPEIFIPPGGVGTLTIE
jgi:hypothetical protein